MGLSETLRRAFAIAILRRLLINVGARLASDPRVRAKAADVLEHEVKPRAAAAWRRTKPKLEAAREELRDIAAEADPRENPRAFAAKLKDRMLDRERNH